LVELAEEYRERPLQIVEVAEGYRMCTRPDFSFWVRRFLKASRKSRLSQASLESLAIIAYKQPLTRAEIEQVRRVDCSGVLNTLLERNLIRILGRRDVVGRPIVYGTTPYFLEHFGFRNLADMPRPDDLEGMEAFAAERQEGEIVPLADSSERVPGTGGPEGTEEIPAPNPLQTLQESAELAEADATNGHANGSTNGHTHSTGAVPEGAETSEGEGAAEKPV
ncbi:MAG: SMC-Scp complex subunit ScpB, partial [Nitrospinota bacterium]|nr:SMC-Scp complex subunit ScpB [Nitrospinota bacterium]